MKVLPPIHPLTSGLFKIASYGNVALLLGAVLLIYTSVSTYLSWRRLKHIPGPPGAAFSKWWMLRNTLSGNMHLALKQACDDFGKRTLASCFRTPSLNARRNMHVSLQRTRRKRV